MCWQSLELVLADALDLLTISVEIAASLEEGNALVEDRVGQASDTKHVVGRVESLFQNVLWRLVVEVLLTVWVQLMIIFPVFDRCCHIWIPRHEGTESKSGKAKKDVLL